jgi:hypothetical protein
VEKLAEKGKQEFYESYPAWIVLVTTLVSVLVYAIGVYILSQIWIGFGALFVIYLIILEISFWREGCVSCYYYGKRCAFGRGKLAPLLFKRGDPKRFCEKEIHGKDLIPQILVLVFTVAGGVFLLYNSFSWLILGLVVIPPIVWVFGNPIIYGKLACVHCKQGKICCPASEFFSGKRKQKKKSPGKG